MGLAYSKRKHWDRGVESIFFRKGAKTSAEDIVMTTERALRARNHQRKFIQSLALFVFSISLGLFVLTGIGHSANVSLAWNANSEPNIAGYKVYYGTTSHVYDWVLDVGKVTTFTVTGLTAGLTYYFVVTTYDTSNLESAYSNQVSTSTCTYSISPPSESFTASGGTGTVSVSTQSTCPWTASNNTSWMTINSGSNGTGNGTASYSIAANTDSSSRTASTTIARSTFTVTQAGSSITTYAITASAGSGGTISPSGNVTVNRGTNRAFTITPNSGYSISGVTVDGSSVGAVGTYTFSNVTANHTISASFTANPTTYAITASAGSGGTISPSGNVTVNRGTNRAFTITPNSGYSISGVTVDGSSVGAVGTYTFSNVTANHTISASFTANPTTYAITASAGSGGTISPSGNVTVNRGTNRAFTITPNSGYSISGVTVDGSSVGAVGTYTFSNVTANHTISASFTANPTTYAITASAGSGGTISPSGNVTVNRGTNRAFTITPNSGYSISGVTVDGSSVGAVGTYTFSNVTANHTISASFTANPTTYTLTIKKAGSGTGKVTNNPSGSTFTPGTVVNLIAKPDAGSSFTGWSGGCSGTTSTCNVTMNANVSVTTTFTLSEGPSNITITSPVGGETLSAGSTWNIAWTAPSEAVKFNLFYSTNNGFTWKAIVKNVTGTSYQWSIPAIANNKTQCKVKVVGYNAQGKKIASDISIGTFAIQVLKLTSLNGGEKLIAGASSTIQWTSYSTVRDVAGVKLFYTLNGGNTWKKIESLTNNPGRYTWTIPATNNTKTKCKIKVILKAPGGATIDSDESAGFFSISPAS